MATNKGDDIHRLIDENGLKSTGSMGDDTRDANAFHMLGALQAQGRCVTPSVGVLHASAPASAHQAVDVVVDGPTLESLC
jgi:hypothetical protein